MNIICRSSDKQHTMGHTVSVAEPRSLWSGIWLVRLGTELMKESWKYYNGLYTVIQSAYLPRWPLRGASFPFFLSSKEQLQPVFWGMWGVQVVYGSDPSLISAHSVGSTNNVTTNSSRLTLWTTPPPSSWSQAVYIHCHCSGLYLNTHREIQASHHSSPFTLHGGNLTLELELACILPFNFWQANFLESRK